MTPEQEARFKAWSWCRMADREVPIARAAWEAALNTIPTEISEGYYKIGEEVLVKFGEEWELGFVCATSLTTKGQTAYRDHVRRKPAWTPKEGEVVFVLSEDGVRIGRFDRVDATGLRLVSFMGGSQYVIPLERLKPFSPSKIGKPWSEI